MRSLSLAVASALALAACSAPPNKVVDAGRTIDTSCGLDCEAQHTYGLMINTCFEYASSPTASDPPAIGAWVKDLFTLEGGVKTIPVEYRQAGQTKMFDYFGIAADGKLVLMRREFAAGQSITFKNATNDIVGVPWLELDSALGTNLDTTATGDVLNGTRTQESTTYRVTIDEPSASQLLEPVRADPFDGGLRMLFSESPDHGSDAVRIWVPNVGFVNFSTAFALSGGTASQYRLQKIRTIGNDGGATCSLGGI
jgi:hypothetical protein